MVGFNAGEECPRNQVIAFVLDLELLMDEEIRQSRSMKIRPSVLRKAHHRAIESQRRLGEWVEEAIEEKVAREEREKRPPKKE